MERSRLSTVVLPAKMQIFKFSSPRIHRVSVVAVGQPGGYGELTEISIAAHASAPRSPGAWFSVLKFSTEIQRPRCGHRLVTELCVLRTFGGVDFS
eukprot:COSAG02_NODE_4892_length_4859_cov_1.859874_1_plen_95_part_10